MPFSATPAINPPLDPGFLPAVLFNRHYLEAARTAGDAVPLVLTLERENGLISRHETRVRPQADSATLLYVERLVKFLIWSRGGWKLTVGGPAAIGRHLLETWSSNGKREFDCRMMKLAYGREFQVELSTADNAPAARDAQFSAGGHLKGCRIGFDLGASDYKVSAVIDGETVFTEETPWSPTTQSNPGYLYHHISAALHRAAAALPRVDAIGGSSAGVIVDNQIRVASLLRSIPEPLFSTAASVFQRIREEWDVPLLVMNDGDVTALAGALSLEKTGILGIAMGSSEAAGFLDKNGRIPGWLNELAFAPVDYNPQAPKDEWSGDSGVGALYFSQQAVNKLSPAADISFPSGMGLPERLVEVQNLMAAGDRRAAAVYETIGIYLGYTIPHYLAFHDFDHMLILGRVTTGAGGDIILEKARDVLVREFPEAADRVTLHVADEKFRRVGQAVAAASLPEIHC